MPQAQNDILRVAARASIAGVGDFVNVFHYRYTGAGAYADLATVTDLALEMDTLYTILAPRISNLCLYQDVNVYNATQFRPLGVVPFPVLVAGGSGGDPLPAQVAGFVRGLSGYSRNWARKFIGPIGEADNTPTGVLSATLLGALVSFGAEWVFPALPGFSSIFTPVVYHSKFDLWRPLTSAVISNLWATVRRRRVNRGS